ncbi:hypothetical protein LTR84_004297 [Exophiala bonariae]|uniref:Xylanolytic transcriptional activator regulatory domain-containing protein n=1 Tax=Exophiala bonariae TaxID=1690606 RepID=A0AAV9N4E6_9EURO|nr:hypothetical protein LTR84_004297 [Exophiala bonariae]
MPQRTEGAEVYPLRHAADDYLHCFWEFIHPVFPILHRPSFMRRFEALWSESQGPNAGSKQDEFDHIVFVSSLNLVFALGCQFSDLVREPNRAHVAEEFYQRARKLFIYDILDSASITLVQMLLLTSVYLQSTSHANRCWNVVGLAVRAAQSIGMDSEPPSRTPRDPLTRELRRRLWHTCVTMDRLVAMTFGRATITSGTESVPKPLVIDDEYLTEQHEGVQPSEEVPRLGLFVWSLKLYDILHEILATLYNKRSERPGPRGRDGENWNLLSDILTLNQRLDEFQAQLPEYLRPQTQSMSPPNLRKADHKNLQRHVLHCRFLYTRVILLRPLLLLGNDLDSLSTPSATTPHLKNIMFTSACSLCVQTGHLLLEKLRENLEGPYRVSAWHSVYLAVGAAIVLLSAQKCASFRTESEQAALGRSWQRCLAVLGHYKQRINAAHHAIRVLESLRHEMMSRYSKGNDTGRKGVMEPRIVGNEQLQDNGGNASSTERNAWGDFPEYYAMDTPWNGFDFPEEGTAWLSQHLVDLDWMDLPWVPPT